MRIAIHQMNFAPWLPYFYKMAMADKFIFLNYVQFEKNGYQNRYKTSSGKWVTKPVNSGMNRIFDKNYTDGKRLWMLNMQWILAIKETLNIDTELHLDYEVNAEGTKRLIKLIKDFGGDTYITNPDAKNKYLDEKLMTDAGIKIEYCKVPKHLQIHTFEAFEKWGIEGTRKQLPKKEVLCAA